METKSMKSTKGMKSTWVSLILLAGMILTTTAYIYALGEKNSHAAAVEQNRADRLALGELAKYDQLSALFRAVSKTVTPAVVEVRITKKVTVSRGPDMDDFMRRFFDEGSPFHRGRPSQPRRGRPRGLQPKQREYFSRGLGSGMIVDAANGYILTNNHVVADADTVEVILYDKRKFKAQWVRRDGQTDLAVIKIKADGLIEAPLGDSDKMAVGDWVLAIGSPRGLDHTVTAGIISAKSRVTGQTSYENMLQTDAAINRGNSGGPLVNMKGEIIGINNSIATYSGGNEGIGFAIPANMARRIMTQLIENGKVVRGFLGVGIQNVTDRLARSFNLPHTNGALITTVAKGTPAERAKLQEEDFIVRIDGRDVANVNELRNVVANIKPGRTVEMVIYRGGEKMSVKVTIAPQPADMAGAFGISPRGEKAARDRYGLRVQTLTPELAARGGYDKSLKGVIITGVKPGSDAAEQGLRAGMVITRVMGRPVAKADDFLRVLSGKNAKSGVRLRVVSPGGAKRFVFITPVTGGR